MDNTADILIHVHPEYSPEDRCRIEEEVSNQAGVICAKFDQHRHPHALTVLYNPDSVHSSDLLGIVRKHDPDAAMAGL